MSETVLSERDIALDGGFGQPFDSQLAGSIDIVGFADEADAGLGEVAFIGFDDEPPASAAAAEAASAGRRGGADSLRGVGATALAMGAALGSYLRYFFAGTHLRARRSRGAVVVAAALLLSIGAGVLLRSVLPARNSEPTAEAVPLPLPAPAKPVLVARQPIPRGHVLQANDLTWQQWPGDALKPSYVVLGSRPIENFYGYVAREPIAQGDPISAGNIVSSGDRGFMAALLHPGMRAVSVAIALETVSGLVMPGDYVDIMLALPVPALDAKGNDDSAKTRSAVETVLSNIRVLAINQTVDAEPGKAIPGSIVTLEVTPKQAEMVTLADDIGLSGGKLTMSLKSLVPGPADGEAGAARSHTLDTDVSKLLPKRPVSTTASKAAPDKMTIVRGSEKFGQQMTPPGS